MKSYIFIFSVILLVSSKPTDVDEPMNKPVNEPMNEPMEEASASESTSAESDSNPSIITGILSDIPSDEYSETFELPSDEIRIRRNVNQFGTHPKNNSQDIGSGGSTEEPVKVPLRGLITAVESDLVTEALQINAKLRRRRCNSNETNVKENKTSKNGGVDVHQDLFNNLFNFTRPQRETEDKDVKIPLNGLVNAVESTLIHSAQNIRIPKIASHENDTSEESTTGSNASARLKRDTTTEDDQSTQEDSEKEPVIQVHKLDSSNLDLLNPITFKSVKESPATESTTIVDDEELTATTVTPSVHKTNLTLIGATRTVSLIPSTDNKVHHIQHQAISHSIFHSNLAIFPTILPKTINAPLPHATTSEPSIVETTGTAKVTEETNKSEKDEKLTELEKLKEKFAEVQAKPVILSQI